MDIIRQPLHGAPFKNPHENDSHTYRNRYTYPLASDDRLESVFEMSAVRLDATRGSGLHCLHTYTHTHINTHTHTHAHVHTHTHTYIYTQALSHTHSHTHTHTHHTHTHTHTHTTKGVG